MKNYNKHFEFEIKNDLNPKGKIKQYFKTYNFEQKTDNNHLVFVKKWSLLNGWKFNPLNWETKINVKLTKTKNNKAIINHTVISNGFLTPIVFSTLFKSFLLNLEQFVNQHINFKEKNNTQIKLAKKKVFKYYGLLIIGILLGLFTGIILKHFTGIKLFDTVGIIIGAITTKNIMNEYLVRQQLV